MKKLKIAIVSVLALVLCVLLVTGNTFSWFSRPKELEGKSLDFSENYNASVGDSITFATYESTDGVTYGTEEVTSFSETAGVASGARKYYRTDITNTGANAQSVSLYLESLTLGANADGLALGVNGPAKTYKTFVNSDSAVVEEIYLQNVYLGLHSIEVGEGKLVNNIDYMHAWNDSGITYDTYFDTMVDTGETGKYTDTSGWKSEETYDIYAVPIDSRCTNMKLKSKNNDWINTEATIYNSDGYVNNTMIFYEWGGNYYVDAVKSDFNSRLDTFYSSASLKTGESVNLAATYHGKSISYSSSNNSVATVNTSGVVTGVSSGVATITVKVYGVYGDCIESDCVVTVTSADNQIPDVPVVTNVNIAPSEQIVDGETVTYVPSISVYWYIKNDSANDGMTYTIPELYLTL